MRILVASALGGAALRSCVESLLETIPADVSFDLHVLREQATREATLNRALESLGRDDDWLFVGDDIRFTPGWWQAVARGLSEADVVGLATLDPATGAASDRGYRLVEIDGDVTLEAIDRGARPEALDGFGVRACDAVCGCLFAVRRRVFERVGGFREEGANRWGELIFAQEARRAGHRIAVVDHWVEHRGVGTKSHASLALRSTSHAVEAGLWQRVVDRFVDRERIAAVRRSAVSDALVGFCGTGETPLLLYGIGTVARRLDAVLGLGARPLVVTSGLSEETGLEFAGTRVVALDEIDFHRIGRVLVTPLHRGEQIVRETLRPRLPEGFRGRLAWVEHAVVGDEERYTIGEERPPTAGRVRGSASGRVATRMP